MKRLILILILFCSGIGVAQEQSDYLIVKSFQEKANSLKAQINQAASVNECMQDSLRIVELQRQFAPDTVLLNNALYPLNYQQQIASLYGVLSLARQRLGVIESQVSQINSLQNQINALSDRVDSLSKENDKLLASLDVMSKALGKNRETIESLQRIISRLRNDIRARDAAIFAMTDSLFGTYGSNIQSLPEHQRSVLIRKMERHDVVGKIYQAARQNLRFLETAKLNGKQLVQMLKEQQKFSSNWNGLGPKLSRLYVNSRVREREVAAVDTAISQWGQRADSALWSGLYQVFAENNVKIDSFSNADEFVGSLSNYFDTDGGNKNASGGEKSSKLKHFLGTVWNPTIGSQWLPMLVGQGVLSGDQQIQLQTKLAGWEDSARPSYTLAYVLIIVVLALLVPFILTRRKKKPIAPQHPMEN